MFAPASSVVLKPPVVIRLLVFASVRVPVEAVIVKPLTDVARATPKVGLVIIGLVNVFAVNVCVSLIPTKLLVGNDKLLIVSMDGLIRVPAEFLADVT